MRLPDRLGFRGKTLWDWLQLLIVPAILIGVTFAWSASQSRSDNSREERRGQDATLQGYLDEMSGLMLHEKLLDSKEPNDAVRAVARTVTLTALRRLDAERKGAVVRFLHEARLLGEPAPPALASPGQASSGADASAAPTEEVADEDQGRRRTLLLVWLKDADLRGADLTGADLTDAHLSEADLTGANLERAFLDSTDFEGAVLRDADLTRANIGGADLRGADLTGADLMGADLTADDSLAAVIPLAGDPSSPHPSRGSSGARPRPLRRRSASDTAEGFSRLRKGVSRLAVPQGAVGVRADA